MHKYLSYLLASVLLIPAIEAMAAGDPAAGKQKAQSCAACHGPDGNSVNPIWPNIAGQHSEYLKKQLMDFKSGRRENALMTPMAAPLGDTDIEDVAAYFSSQTVKIGGADPALATTGEKLYRAGNPKTGLPACMACHGPNGVGNPAAKYPLLSGQHADYTVATLKAYKVESRANDPDSIMRSIAGKLTNAEIEALAGYIQGLH